MANLILHTIALYCTVFPIKLDSTNKAVQKFILTKYLDTKVPQIAIIIPRFKLSTQKLPSNCEKSLTKILTMVCWH